MLVKLDSLTLYVAQGMAPMREELETNLRARVGKHIYIIDGVQAAIEMAAGMSRMRMSARAV